MSVRLFEVVFVSGEATRSTSTHRDTEHYSHGLPLPVKGRNSLCEQLNPSEAVNQTRDCMCINLSAVCLLVPASCS